MELPKAIHELEFNHGSIYGDEEAAALHDVLAASAPSCGPKVKQFEEAFAAYCGTRHRAGRRQRHDGARAGHDRGRRRAGR